MEKNDLKPDLTPSEIPGDIAGIFRPGGGADLVFGIATEWPDIRHSTIYELDQQARTMILAQTDPPISKKTVGLASMDVTAMTKTRENIPMRAAIRCSLLALLNSYELAGGAVVRAILVRHEAKIRQANIRSGFRVAPSAKYEVDCFIKTNDSVFSSDHDMFVRDISVSGMGLTIPRLVNNARNRLFFLPRGARLETDIVLRDLTCAKPAENRIKTTAAIVRRNEFHSKNNGIIALEFKNLDDAAENALGLFIQRAQLLRIRNIRAPL